MRTGSRGKGAELRLGTVALVVIGAAMGFSASILSAPFVPERDDQVLERIPARLNGALLELRLLRWQLEREPANLNLATRLARRYIEIGRAEFDPRYFGYAQAALAPWLEMRAPPPDILVLRAILKQQRHDFDGALSDLESLLQQDPRNAQAWLSSATILQVQGENRQALARCASLASLPGSYFVGTVCLGKSLSLSGRADQAYRLLRELRAGEPDVPAPERLWMLTILAEIAVRQGRPERAERHFLDALSLGLRDSYLLAAFADFLLDEQQPERVRELLREEARVDGLLLRLAQAERQLGLPIQSRVKTLKGRYAASRRRGDTVHLGEQARFALHIRDDPRAALELALANWNEQREPRDARIVLEAALAADDSAAAQPVLRYLERTSLQDVGLAELASRLREAR
ncbi:MAG: tetratricopeptide repeat protein [Gammaproteobacteria bacterium]